MGVDEIYIPLRFTEFTHQRNLFHTSRSKSVEMVSAKKFSFSALATWTEFIFQTQVVGWMSEGASWYSVPTQKLLM